MLALTLYLLCYDNALSYRNSTYSCYVPWEDDYIEQAPYGANDKWRVYESTSLLTTSGCPAPQFGRV